MTITKYDPFASLGFPASGSSRTLSTACSLSR